MSPMLLNPFVAAPVGPPPGYAGLVLGEPTLIGYWRQGEPAAATVMADSGPGGHPGVYRFGSKTAEPSLLSGDSDLATSGDAGAVGHGSWMDVSAITVECIIKTPGSIGGNQGVFTRFDGSGHCWLIWMNVFGQIAARFYNTLGASVDLTWATAPSASTKYHVAAKYTSGLAELLVDGVVVDSSTSLTGDLQTSASVGIETMAYNGAGFGFTGVGDEFALYSSIISDADLAAHAALV